MPSQTPSLTPAVFRALLKLSPEAQELLEYGLEMVGQVDKALVIATVAGFPGPSFTKDPSFHEWFSGEFIGVVFNHKGHLPLDLNTLVKGLEAATKHDIDTVREIYGKFRE